MYWPTSVIAISDYIEKVYISLQKKKQFGLAISGSHGDPFTSVGVCVAPFIILQVELSIVTVCFWQHLFLTVLVELNLT